MSNLILHGGAPKTGTSFLQVMFARYADALLDGGVVYPGSENAGAAAGKVTSGNGVAMANYLRPNLPHKIADKSAFIHELEDILAGSEGRHVLYSSEFLMVPPNDQAKAILSVAQRHGYRPRYVYFVRDISTVAVSAYSQAVKRHGETRSFEEFLRTTQVGYGAAIRQACSAFGVENVEVYNYDEHKSELAEFFFRRVLGIEVDIEESSVVNRSLTPRELEFQRLMNLSAPGQKGFSQFISDALISIPVESKTQFAVTKEEAGILSDRFGDVVDYVNEKVRGKSICIADHIVEQRENITLTDFERSIASILARLVKAIIKN